jgi:hypothetical protein
MTDRSAFDPFAPPPAAPVELTERAADAFAPPVSEDASSEVKVENGEDVETPEFLSPADDASASTDASHAEHVAFIASELEAGLARKGIDV